MPTVDPKPRHRPFRRVLYREDSKDSTFTQDVSPRSDGYLLTKLNKKHNRQIIENNHKMLMTNGSRRLLMKEGILYKKPAESIKYVKRIRNDPMARYLFVMQQYFTPNMSALSHYENQNIS
ncbi:unnamed protein product [Rotaria sp. Silwood2]|nr:unnamed protein product [Rotaria sp. Silwood2]CAF2528489.1 unnamed protein product [Rotaria sp. Silwood2]CAF2786227.1 unnamed protein product [Rotaria sp. Silwood2]CAF2938909.1 unnamed protein product [Rotaria sp. Silwood2]CAF3896373.1 unnamed protein product [Rotaria sp. Silwood2]